LFGRRVAPPYLWLALAGLVAIVVSRRVTRLAITGDSMAPTFVHGDHILVVRWRRPRRGDIVAARDPRHPERTIVKRVAHLERGGLVLLGDNPSASTDSRHFGPVDARLVRGLVVLTYVRSTRRR
jgi:nickel-type superoxide dismutase maturation protease